MPKGVYDRKSRPIAERFFDKVEAPPYSAACWLWKASVRKDGYGRIGGEPQGRTIMTAHRVSHILFVGPIPTGLSVLHTCDNRICVNPDHLWLGTLADNLRDMAEKGRGRNGNTGKTHCLRGHALTPDNTYLSRGGSSRTCRTCNLAWQRTYRANEKASA